MSETQRSRIENGNEAFIAANSYDDPDEDEYVIACRSEPVIFPVRRQREDLIRRSNCQLVITKHCNDERTDPVSASVTRRLDKKMNK